MNVDVEAYIYMFVSTYYFQQINISDEATFSKKTYLFVFLKKYFNVPRNSNTMVW